MEKNYNVTIIPIENSKFIKPHVQSVTLAGFEI